jgi:hypothetical protein
MIGDRGPLKPFIFIRNPFNWDIVGCKFGNEDYQTCDNCLFKKGDGRCGSDNPQESSSKKE